MRDLQPLFPHVRAEIALTMLGRLLNKMCVLCKASTSKVVFPPHRFASGFAVKLVSAGRVARSAERGASSLREQKCRSFLLTLSLA